jgi:hypothetical protein
VQEQQEYPCYAAFVPQFLSDYTNTPGPLMDFRFCDFYLPVERYLVSAGLNRNYELDSFCSVLNWTMRDCNVQGGAINLGEPDDGSFHDIPADTFYGSASVAWTNNLFEGVDINLAPTYNWLNGTNNVDFSFQARNNLFRRGPGFTLVPVASSAGNWTLTDNLFDLVEFAQDTAFPLDYGYNAYWPQMNLSDSTNAGTLLATTTGDGTTDGVGEQTLPSAPLYQSGPLGNYYMQTGPLFASYLQSKGSRSPAAATLYHYTSLTSQVKDGTQPSVNIGLHYVAANPATGLPQDYDGDGIPDYVEDANGNGVWDQGIETDWQDAYTTSEIFDPTNTIYDDADLSGSGLVGRIKRALGLTPLSTNNPLTLTQVIAGDEPQVLTFELPLDHNLMTNVGGLNLNIDGSDATLDECDPASDGHSLLVWNTAYDPPGQHLIQAEFMLSTNTSDSAIILGQGQPIIFNSTNAAQLFLSDCLYDDTGAYLDAQLASQYVNQNVQYSIQVLDPAGSPPNNVLYTMSSNTTTGVIQADWQNLTCQDGTHFTGNAFTAVFNVIPPSGMPYVASSKKTKLLTNEQGNGFDVVYMYSAANDSLGSSFASGAVWTGMMGVVNVLTQPTSAGPPIYNSSFNQYTSLNYPPGQGANPGYLTSRATVTGALIKSMNDGQTKNFYCNSHGSANWLGDAADKVFLTTADLQPLFKNSFPANANASVGNPFRFVWLDGCYTVSKDDWFRAFGILTSDKPDQIQAVRCKVKPQAFVGWLGEVSNWMGAETGNSADDANFAQGYTQTLVVFYTLWMQGMTLRSCLDMASSVNSGTCPLPVQGNEHPRIYLNGILYQPNVKHTGKICVMGHSGLTRQSLSLNDDGYYLRPPAKSK